MCSGRCADAPRCATTRGDSPLTASTCGLGDPSGADGFDVDRRFGIGLTGRLGGVRLRNAGRLRPGQYAQASIAVQAGAASQWQVPPGAIARANDCLSSSNMQGQRLRRILDLELDQLEQVQRDSVIVTGDDPFLPAEAASILSLALHELTNNAIKYGALATPGARIEMTCRFDQRGTFHLDWHETMPKAPAPAGRSGFGTLLLTEVIARQLEAEVSHDLTDQGLRYAIRFVLSDGR